MSTVCTCKGRPSEMATHRIRVGEDMHDADLGAVLVGEREEHDRSGLLRVQRLPHLAEGVPERREGPTVPRTGSALHRALLEPRTEWQPRAAVVRSHRQDLVHLRTA